MNDILLVAVVPVTIVLVAVVYHIADHWWMNRSDCNHSWNRWSDPQKDTGHPYQTRYCSKCNQYQQRIIQ